MFTVSYDQVKPLPSGKIIKLYGPPGTGKTTTLTAWMYHLVVDHDFDPAHILATGYSRAAVEALKTAMKEAGIYVASRRRATGQDGKLPANASSIMQLLWAGGNLGGSILHNDTPFHKGDSIYNYLRRHKIDASKHLETFNELLDLIYKSSTPDTFNVKRTISRLNLTAEQRKLVPLITDFVRYQEAIERYSYSFAYYNYLKNPDAVIKQLAALLPGLRFLVIDEAQDMTPLMHDFVNRLAAELGTIEHIVYAGDDDQAIYNYAGADHTLFNSIQGDVVVLDKTYRYGQKIHGLATRIVHKIKNRYPKDYNPGDVQDVIVKMNGHLDDKFMQVVNHAILNGETLFILKRVNRGLGKLSQILESQYIPHTFVRDLDTPESFVDFTGGKNYRDYKRNLEKFHEITAAIADILLFEPPAHFLRQDLQRYLDINFDYNFDTTWSLKESGASGAQKMKPLRAAVVVALHNPKSLEMFTQRLKWELKLHRSITPARLKHYILTSVSKRIRIGTIHSSKGLQADNVLLHIGGGQSVKEALSGDDMTRDNELRVWYVGATRAKKTLTILSADATIMREVLS